ncbi:MAG: hypothetical protein K6A77_08485 [Clostridiales bacterium]|nr:hypothetical protein [Clostridiales bacterium]
MKARSEKDVEDLIRNTAFPNPGHKQKLKRRLMEQMTEELDLEDLDMAAGGVTVFPEEIQADHTGPDLSGTKRV